MLELRLAQGSLLKEVLQSIQEHVKEANFSCSTAGFLLSPFCNGTVFTELLLGVECFEYYKSDGNISMGLNVTDMLSMLDKFAANDESITIKAGDNGSDTLTFIFKSPDQDKTTDNVMKLKDIDKEPQYRTDFISDAIVKMPSEEFARICQQLNSPAVQISVTQESVKFTTKETMGDDITIIEVVDVDVELNRIVSVTYDLSELKSFTKATPFSNTVTLRLVRDCPIVVKYGIAETGFVQFLSIPWYFYGSTL